MPPIIQLVKWQPASHRQQWFLRLYMKLQLYLMMISNMKGLRKKVKICDEFYDWCDGWGFDFHFLILVLLNIYISTISIIVGIWSTALCGNPTWKSCTILLLSEIVTPFFLSPSITVRKLWGWKPFTLIKCIFSVSIKDIFTKFFIIYIFWKL